MVDTCLRRSEICSLNWGNGNLQTGVCMIRNGKGKKDRIVVLGIIARRALITYRRRVSNTENSPLFQTNNGKRLTVFGLRSVLLRLGDVNPNHHLGRLLKVLSKAGEYRKFRLLKTKHPDVRVFTGINYRLSSIIQLGGIFNLLIVDQ